MRFGESRVKDWYAERIINVHSVPKRLKKLPITLFVIANWALAR